MGKLFTFLIALVRHIVAGSKNRTHTEIAYIFETICKPCEISKLKDENSGYCMECGCNIRNDANGLNMIKWADKKCPLNKW